MNIQQKTSYVYPCCILYRVMADIRRYVAKFGLGVTTLVGGCDWP